MKKKKQKMVLIGGGTALSTIGGNVAQCLHDDYDRFRQCIAIQAPYDNGRHSGSIVDEYEIFAPGDQGKAILAFSEPWMKPNVYKALSRRNWHPEWPSADQTEQKKPSMLLDDPPLRNLIMLSGMLRYGKMDPGKGLLEGIDVFSKVCGMRRRFKVLPTSLDMAVLQAELADGTFITGQKEIAEHFDFDQKRIVSLKLVPPAGKPYPRLYEEARKAIIEADKIVFTSGSWWTSVQPNPLVEGFREALEETKAKIIMVVNLVTAESEAAFWNSGQFIENLSRAVNRPFDAILCNDWNLQMQNITEKEDVAKKLGEERLCPVFFSKPDMWGLEGTAKPSIKPNTIIQGLFAEWNGKSFVHNKHTAERILNL